MKHKEPIHLVDPSSRNRAEIATTAYALGHHAEVYADIEELCQRPLIGGIVLVRDDPATGGIAAFMKALSRRGVWLPVVAIADDVTPPQIVAAMKAGALDYLPLPLDQDRLGRTLEALGAEAAAFREARQRMLEARNRITKLSGREREVLDWLSNGLSNKAIARELDISPRTVEIHRSNMMAKLGAGHSAEAVRMRIEADLEMKIPA